MKFIIYIFLLPIVIFACTNRGDFSTQDKNYKINKITETIAKRTNRKEWREDLSKEFNFKVVLEEYDSIDTFNIKWKIYVFNKKNILFDSIIEKTDFYSRENFENQFVSFSTKINLSSIKDSYSGNFVIADFNFDGKDDFAITSALGSSTGTFYNFFINENRSFKKDIFLTNTTFFPNTFDKKNKILINNVHCGACIECENKYQYNSITKKWKQIVHNEIDICN